MNSELAVKTPQGAGMNSELAVIEPRALTAPQMKAHVQLIQRVMDCVMKEGTHYGVIPGTDKPSLLKPGCEVLMSTFRISVEPKIEDLSTAEEIRYRVHCTGTHQTTGTVMGTGIGECSSKEEKYKWKRSNDREFANTPEDRRRIKYGYNRQKREEFETKQVRTEPADVANTVLKMAKKRALVDFTLTALAASDCFNQDLEDMPEEIRDNGSEPEKRTVQQPKAKIDPLKKIAEGQLTVLQKAIDRSGSKVTAEAFCKHFEIPAIAELPFAKINEALKYVSDRSE